MKSLDELEAILGYKFKNISYLRNALTHTSYINEHKNVFGGSNERMEFLGDSVLGLSVSDYLYNNYKKRPEGELSKIRASVVCETALADLASKLNLGEFLFLGKGEYLNGGECKPSVTSDAMESVIAAIYLDGGFSEAKNFVLKWLAPYIVESACHGGRDTDYKTTLQEYCQSRGKTPKYTLISERGPDHNKIFETRVSIGGNISSCGKGHNKKLSQQAAAKELLKKLGI